MMIVELILMALIAAFIGTLSWQESNAPDKRHPRLWRIITIAYALSVVMFIALSAFLYFAIESSA